MKHTKGKWTMNNYWTMLEHDHPVIYVRHNAEIIAQCWKTGCDRGLSDKEREIETEANARLIAASTTMYSYISKKANEGDVTAREILETINNA